MERSTPWNVVPIYCENVIIRGITVNSIEVLSGGRVDIESCKNVLTKYCTLNCGNDCFTLKTGRADDGLCVGKATEDIIIRHSLAQHGHDGITIGNEIVGMIKNLYVHDRMFDGTRTGIHFKARRNRGGDSDHTIYERLRMINVGRAFIWDFLGNAHYMDELAARYPEHAVDYLAPNISNTVIKDFIVESSKQPFTANGIPEIPFSSTLIEDGIIHCQQPTSALQDAKNFQMKNLIIHSQDNTIKLLDCGRLTLQGINFDMPQNELIIEAEGDRRKKIEVKECNVPHSTEKIHKPTNQ